jgi:transcriptional regulator with XRE-family HTH domain
MPAVDLQPAPVDPELRALASNLRRLREQRQLSRREVAERIGASQRQIEHWENAESVPGLRHLIEISRLFRQSIESLLFDPSDAVSLERAVRHMTTYVDLLTKITGASVILNVSWQPQGGPSNVTDVNVRAMPEAAAAGLRGTVEIKGFISSAPEDPDMESILESIKASEGIPTDTDPEGMDNLQNLISESHPD